MASVKTTWSIIKLVMLDSKYKLIGGSTGMFVRWCDNDSIWSWKGIDQELLS